MKRFLSFLSVILTAVTISSCSKGKVDSVQLDIDVNNILTKAAWVDIVPSTNDFSFFYEVMSLKQYETDVRSEMGYIKVKDAELKSIYNSLVSELGVDSRFSEVLLYQGAIYFPEQFLEPSTEYIVLAFAYDQDENPMTDVLFKHRFKTSDYVPSDIKFNVALDGRTVKVIPSNGDQYYWDYERKEIVDEEHYNTPILYYFSSLMLNIEYGFIPEYLVSGEEAEDMSSFFKMTPGDKFYLVASGYNNGPNSNVSVFLLTYNGEGKEGTVEKVGEYNPWTFQEEHPDYSFLKGASAPGTHLYRAALQ